VPSSISKLNYGAPPNRATRLGDCVTILLAVAKPSIWFRIRVTMPKSCHGGIISTSMYFSFFFTSGCLKALQTH